jgi:hypothetical protein
MIKKTLLLAALLAPSAALAQTAPKYEFGVDAAVAYTKPDEGDGVFQIAAPLDVRVGFLRPDPLTFEPRFTFNFQSGGGVGSTVFTPTLNVLYQQNKRALVQRGMYFTAGLGLNIVRFTIDEDVSPTGEDESETETEPVINFGVGTRRSITQGGFRPEGFIAYGFDSEALTIGARLGLSFWK